LTRGPLLALALILLPLGARAWEEERALAWIVAHSPLLQAQRAVTQAHLSGDSINCPPSDTKNCPP
jgi:hypothetical protein